MQKEERTDNQGLAEAVVELEGVWMCSMRTVTTEIPLEVAEVVEELEVVVGTEEVQALEGGPA